MRISAGCGSEKVAGMRDQDPPLPDPEERTTRSSSKYSVHIIFRKTSWSLKIMTWSQRKFP